MTISTGSPRCSATVKSTGEQCRMRAIKGATVCRSHGAGAPQVRAKAAIVAEINLWRLSDATDDPGETLLRMITQSRMRADAYATELERLATVDPAAHLADVLVGESKVWTGERLETVGDYIRGIVRLEAEERDRCARFCKLAIDAGLAERMVRLAEAQGELLAQVIRGILADLNLNDEQRRLVAEVVPRHLRSVSASA